MGPHENVPFHINASIDVAIFWCAWPKRPPPQQRLPAKGNFHLHLLHLRDAAWERVKMRPYWLNQFWHTHSTPSLWILDIRDSVRASGLSAFSNLLEIDQTAIGITCSKGLVGSPWMSTTHTTLLIRPLFWSLALKPKEQVAQPVCKQVCRRVPGGRTWHSLACTMGLWGRRVVLELTISQ